MRATRPALLLLSSSLLALHPSAAHAAAACIARTDTPFSTPTIAGTPGTPVGTLARGRCYGVLDRAEGRTRIFVKSPGFAGEAEIADDAVLYVLAEDIPLTLKSGEEPFGLALAGTAVEIEEATAGGHLVRTVDGRMQVRFLVPEGAMLPSDVWPSADPGEIDPGGDWPDAAWALPPSSAVLSGSSGRRALVSEPLFALDSVIADPHLGALRYAFVGEPGIGEATVRIVAPNVWVDGTVSDLDWRRETVPTETPFAGWEEKKGFRIAATVAPQPREVAAKDAPLLLSAKGARFGTLSPGARLDVVAEDGSWLEIAHRWSHGTVRGWLDKKRLTREGKEVTTPAATVARAAIVTVHVPAVVWRDKGPEHEVDKAGKPRLDKAGQPVVDPNKTHVVPCDYDATWLRGAIREQVARLRYLYGLRLSRDPAAGGAVTLRFVIDGKGAIVVPPPAEEGAEAGADPGAEEPQAIELIEATLGDSAVSELLLATVTAATPPERTLKLARADKKDYAVVVTVTLTFASLGG